MRKPDYYICENKGADQLRHNRATDQRLCFLCLDSTILLLSKSEVSTLWPSYVAVPAGFFVSDLVGNTLDRFSHDAAHICQVRSEISQDGRSV